MTIVTASEILSGKQRLSAYTPAPPKAAARPACRQRIVPAPCSWSWLARRSRALLFKLRVGSALVHERLYHQGRVDSALCAACGSCETLEHLILHCPTFVTQRALLIKEYKFLGFKCVITNDHLFPGGRASRRDQAHRALLTFMDQTYLATRLYRIFFSCFRGVAPLSLTLSRLRCPA